MRNEDSGLISAGLRGREGELLRDWLTSLKTSGATESGRIGDQELSTQAQATIGALVDGFEAGSVDIRGPAFSSLRDHVAAISRSRAVQGFTPRETAMFVLSLKRPVLALLARKAGEAAVPQATMPDTLTGAIDELAVYTLEVFQKSREEVIVQQQQEISELSTPVIKLWNGILALPLIGTLDSQRTQVVMENLLEAIVAQSADIAIIDITGVPTVDTLTAQHLLKTIAAARLMGADCIISGIRPQIAQTMVHLGVELTVISKATLADAFALALARQGRGVVRLKPPAGEGFTTPGRA
jgi:rsbT co-antagonist protein RsbR